MFEAIPLPGDIAVALDKLTDELEHYGCKTHTVSVIRRPRQIPLLTLRAHYTDENVDMVIRANFRRVSGGVTCTLEAKQDGGVSERVKVHEDDAWSAARTCVETLVSKGVV